MNASLPLSQGVMSSPVNAAVSTVEIPQYRRGAIFAVWAAAALPMAALAWLVAPALAHHLAGSSYVPLAKALIVCLTVGLVWQFVLVVILVRREQRSLRWPTIREALWLRPPRSPRNRRIGGWVWLAVIPFVLAYGAEQLVPSLPGPVDRDLGSFLGSPAGQTFIHGNWVWLGVLIVLFVFNTVLGEELLFRGFLLPRMNGAFGRRDWVANGLLFAAYHLHMPWAIPTALLDTLIISYPAKRYRSAWIGIAVHSAQSLFLAALVLALVVR